MSVLSAGVFSWSSSLIVKYYLFSKVVQYTVRSIILFITPLLHSLQFHPWQNLQTDTSSCCVFFWYLTSLQLPLPGVTLFLLLTELLVVSLLASQGGWDISTQRHLTLWYAPGYPHFQWNLQSSTMWILSLFLILTMTWTRSTPLFLFLPLCFKLHLLSLTVTPLTISWLRLSNNYQKTLIEDQHQSLSNQRLIFWTSSTVLTLTSLITSYFSTDSIFMLTLCNFPLMKKKSISWWPTSPV